MTTDDLTDNSGSSAGKATYLVRGLVIEYNETQLGPKLDEPRGAKRGCSSNRHVIKILEFTKVYGNLYFK